MRKESIINGLKMTADLLLFDPITGDEITREQLNRTDRITYDSCVGAISLLSKDFSRLTEEYIKEYCDKHNLTVVDNDFKEEFVKTWCKHNGYVLVTEKEYNKTKEELKAVAKALSEITQHECCDYDYEEACDIADRICEENGINE